MQCAIAVLNRRNIAVSSDHNTDLGEATLTTPITKSVVHHSYLKQNDEDEFGRVDVPVGGREIVRMRISGRVAVVPEVTDLGNRPVDLHVTRTLLIREI